MTFSGAMSFPGVSFFRSPFKGTGISDEAQALDKEVKDAIGHLWENETLGPRVHQGFERLQEAADKACESNWDGYGALPVNEISLYQAHEFLNILPLEISLPEVEVDPDGEVSFDWYNEADEVFSISIGKTGRLSFAGLFSSGEVHGAEYFIDEIPQPIVAYLKRFV